MTHFTPPAGGSTYTQVLELLQELSSDGINLKNTEVTVSGGRGVGGPEDFTPLYELATALGGVAGALRTAVDRRQVSKAHQVGQTGHATAPRLYITYDISGVIQHLTDMLGSGTIVTINTDLDARIFRYVDYRIVEDLSEVVPALTREILFHRG